MRGQIVLSGFTNVSIARTSGFLRSGDVVASALKSASKSTFERGSPSSDTAGNTCGNIGRCRRLQTLNKCLAMCDVPARHLDECPGTGHGTRNGIPLFALGVRMLTTKNDHTKNTSEGSEVTSPQCAKSRYQAHRLQGAARATEVSLKWQQKAIFIGFVPD